MESTRKKEDNGIIIYTKCILGTNLIDPNHVRHPEAIVRHKIMQKTKDNVSH